MNRIFKGRVKRVKTWFSLPLIILFLGIVFAYPNLDFYSPTEPNNSYISTNWAEINLTVDMNETLDTFDFDWDYTEMDNYLVGYWILDESSGTNAYDSSGTGNNGTLNGMNTGLNNGTSGWTTSGKKQNAAMFDGADDYINCGNDSSLNITEAITIEAWVKPVDLVTSGLRIVHKNLAYSLFISDLNNSLRFWNYNDNSYGQSTASYTENEWQHVVVIKSGTTVNFYRNGIDVTNDGSISATLGTSAVDLMIGLDEDLSSYPFNGTIDEVRIYNTSLTPEQIKQRYLSTRARFYDDSLVLAMNFNNNSAIGENSTKAADISKYGNNGTINSATWTTNGKFGGALDFDGTDDYVDCGNDSSLDITDAITVEAWVNFAAAPTGHWTAFVSKDEGSGVNNKWVFGYMNGKTVFHVGDASADDFHVYSNEWTPILNQWYHLAVVKSGDTYTFYRDGAADGTDSATLAIPTINAHLEIGRAEGGGCFNGIMDEVRIYNYALSQSQIQEDMMKCTPSTPTA
ncbi:MAG: LamG domain-containing protein, partial [Candidatus Aenigmarchaeota archaeon]|nr:LamG domain-containing protein [Candidatus Aenigmarchaeota archaeon]